MAARKFGSLISWIAMFLVAIPAITACSFQPDNTIKAAPGDAKPALWKVTGKGQSGGFTYLFGTVHLLPPDTNWQSPALDSAIRASEGLVVEVTGLDDTNAVAQVFKNLGLRAGMPPLSARLQPALRQKLIAAAEPVPGPISTLDGMETWAAALTIAATLSSDLGLQQSSGVEPVLQLRFKADDKPVFGLESVTEQLGYFDNLPETEQRIMLAAIVKDADKNSAQFQKLLDRWLSGNVDALLSEIDSGILSSPHIRSALLDNRNRNWATKIGAMIDSGDHRFVAVGAAHLGGTSGVPALLKRAGYTVERVQ